MKGAIVAALLLSVVTTSHAFFLQRGTFVVAPIIGDEFAGPFANWQNVKASPCNATGDGIADDTTAIQTCLTAVGTSANNSVVWFPSGTYKITATLNVNNGSEAIAILCQDPTTTKILWAGAAAGTMIHLNGVDYSRNFSRCAIDGGATNHAAIGIDQSYDGVTGHFDTGNDYEDIIFTHLTTGFQCGFLSNGCSEVVMQRDHFLGLTGNCVTMGNFNALDLWVRWSEFDHCGSDAITNSTGAGNWRSYYNIFRNSGQSDHHQENTGVFSIRGAYSINSGLPYWGGGGPNPAEVTLQNNTFLDWTNAVHGTTEAIGDYNLGTTNIYGNTFRPPSGGTASPCVFGETPDYSLVMYANTFACSPYESGSATTPHVVDIDSTVVSRSAITPGEPILPPTEPNMGRTIFEIPPASTQSTLQTAINNASALAARAVVHIQNQTMSVSGTSGLSIPANSDVQIICDGHNGILQHSNGTGTTSPVLTINGPTKATLRECIIDGNRYGGDGGSEALKVTMLDQAGSQVLMQGVAFNDAATNIALFDQMDHTVVTLRDTSFGFGQGSGAAVKIVGGPRAAAGTPDEGKILWHSGSAGSSILPFDCSNGAYAVLRDIWYEGAASGNKLIHTSGRCTVTVDGWAFVGNPDSSQAIDIVSLNGKFFLGSVNMAGLVGISGTGTNSQVLAVGPNFFAPFNTTNGATGLHGSGGGGGWGSLTTAAPSNSGNGGPGNEWDASHGSGGGGAGGAATTGAAVAGGAGGLYGGGGGGTTNDGSPRGNGGAGAQGIIAYSSPASAARTFIPSGATWAVPAGWNNADNVIEVIAGGGGGRSGTSAGGGGGYSKVVNVTLTPSSTVGVQIGAGGPGGATSGADGTAGGDTWLCNATTNCATIAGTAVIVGAKGGGAGTTAGGAGAGGASASGVGTTKFSGGAGGYTPSIDSGGGGGGAAGPNGNGAAGGVAAAAGIYGGSGGGGNGNGGAGVAATASNGAAGGTAYDATAGGVGGTSVGGTIFSDTSGGTSGLLAARQATSNQVPYAYISPVGTNTPAFVRTMMAQALATTESPIQATPAGISDLRLYRIWAQRGNPYSIHLCAGSC